MGLIHFFFPHKRNSYRALLLTLPALLSYPFILLALLLSLSTFGVLRPGILGVISSIEPQRVIEETNSTRISRGLSPLKENAKLTEAAQKKAQDMVEKGYWAHISPTGQTPWDFMRGEGYSYSIAGENLARDFSDVGSMIAAWLASPSHKENLLNKDYAEIGIGVAQGQVGGRDTLFVIQMFATPAPTIIPLAREKTEQPKPPAGSEAKPLAVNQKLELEKEISQQEKLQVLEEKEIVDVAKIARSGPKFDYFATQKTISVSLVSLLAVLFLIDFAFAKVRHLARPGGHPFFHLLFLILAFFFVWYSQGGLIL